MVGPKSNIPGNLTDPVHSDWRGDIYRHETNGVKYNVLFTKKGVFRSGDFHPAKQFDVILSGEVKLTIREHDQDVVKTYGPNQLIVIPENLPHLFEFLSDCVMIEWWEKPFEASYYAPYRKFVEDQFRDYQEKHPVK